MNEVHVLQLVLQVRASSTGQPELVEVFVNDKSVKVRSRKHSPISKYL